MAIPTWVPGQILTSSDVNVWFVPKVIIKPGDTGRTSTSLSGDPDLVLPVAANSTYDISGIIWYDGGAGGSEGDIKFDFTVPASASGLYLPKRTNLSGGYAASFQFNWTDTVTAETTGVGTVMAIEVAGKLEVAGTAGNLTFRWSKNTAPDGTNTHIKADSYLVANRIA